MTYARADQKVTVEFDVMEFAMLLAILGATLDLPCPAAQSAVKKFIQALNLSHAETAFYRSLKF